MIAPLVVRIVTPQPEYVMAMLGVLLILVGGLTFTLGMVVTLFAVLPALHGEWFGGHGSVVTFVVNGLLIVAVGYGLIRSGRTLEAKANLKTQQFRHGDR